MAATIILVVLISAYSLWILHKKYKDAKKGKFCSCGCQDCPSKCHEFQEEK
ncbi:MAG: FeoB-associated Cys-rich membrane protein [Clostridiales bacterium]|nr:FeoB-associated Cys-rich membrane protein [Clostridiales bacterium]